LAIIYCVWVVVLYLLGGSEPFSRLGITLTRLILTYLAVGVVAGGVIGLLRPLTQTGLGAFLVGYPAAMPITAGLMICIYGWPTIWTRRVWHEYPYLVLVFGTMVGYELDRRVNKPREQSDRKP